jgi:hypothetical protein
MFEEGEVKVIEGDIRIGGEMVMLVQRGREMGLWTVPLNNTRMRMMTQECRNYREK